LSPGARALVFTELQTQPDAPLLVARCHRDAEPPVPTLSPGGSITTAKRYTSTCAVLVLVQVQAHFTQIALIFSHSRIPLMKGIAIYNVPDFYSTSHVHSSPSHIDHPKHAQTKYKQKHSNIFKHMILCTNAHSCLHQTNSPHVTNPKERSN